MNALTSCYARLFAAAVLIAPLSLLGADKDNDDPAKTLGLARMVHPAFPYAALADGLRTLLQSGTLDVRDTVTLLVWAVGGLAAAARWFRWE